jgi:signal transduction histidine kinase
MRARSIDVSFHRWANDSCVAFDASQGGGARGAPNRGHDEEALLTATTTLESRIKASTSLDAGVRRAHEHAVPFTLVAIATAFGLLLVPSPGPDYGEVSIAAVVAAGMLGLALFWDRLPALAALGVPLGFVALAALLRDAAGGNASGFGGLLILPVLWLSMTAGRRQLGGILVAILVAQLVPLVAVGAPRYPISGWRSAFVLTSVAAVAGLMVQRLAGEAQRRAELLQRQAASLERASARLADQNERLLEVDRMKDEFIALVSHELRTPLTSISGYLEMALDGDEEPIPPALHKHLSIAQRNVERLTTLVNQLLFLVRADSHPLELERRPLDLAQIAEDVAETAQPAVKAKGILFDVDLAPLPPVIADPTELLRLVDNLVSNAVKFTPPGGRVRLTARREGRTAVVQVADTGIGIPAHELSDLFQRFFRASSATDNAIPGTGLGLAISRLIAEAHDTTIDVQSTLGEGTTFRFALPLAT